MVFPGVILPVLTFQGIYHLENDKKLGYDYKATISYR
jgi:hypothetical protein